MSKTISLDSFDSITMKLEQAKSIVLLISESNKSTSTVSPEYIEYASIAIMDLIDYSIDSLNGEAKV